MKNINPKFKIFPEHEENAYWIFIVQIILCIPITPFVDILILMRQYYQNSGMMILMCSLVDDSWLVCWHFVLKKHLYYYLELFHFPYQGKSQHKPLWKQNLHLHYNTVIIIILTWIMVGCEKHACLESLYQVCLIQSPDVTNSNK